MWVCWRKTLFFKRAATPGLNKVGEIMIKAVYSYLDRGPGQRLDHPDTLTNEAILPGLTLSLSGIWAAGF